MSHLPRIEISVSRNQTFEWWDVTVSVASGWLRPTAGVATPCRTEARLIFDGPNGEASARDAATQLGGALASLQDAVPAADVDSLLEGIAKQVGAVQITSPDSIFSGVVRSYQRDGAWRSLVYRTGVAETRAEKLAADNKSFEGQIHRLRKYVTKLRFDLESTAIEKIAGANIPDEWHCLLCDLSAPTREGVANGHYPHCPLSESSLIRSGGRQ